MIRQRTGLPSPMIWVEAAGGAAAEESSDRCRVGVGTLPRYIGHLWSLAEYALTMRGRREPQRSSKLDALSTRLQEAENPPDEPGPPARDHGFQVERRDWCYSVGTQGRRPQRGDGQAGEIVVKAEFEAQRSH